MAAACPIVVAEEQVGVLRFVASLGEVNEEIRRVAYSYLLFGGAVILFSGLVSFFLANTITGPLKQVTLAAEEMARGNFNVKAPRSQKTKSASSRNAELPGQ